MGRVEKGENCSVVGCSQKAGRSLAMAEAGQAGLQISSAGRRAYLCAQHYKEWKKEMKKTREYERARWQT